MEQVLTANWSNPHLTKKGVETYTTRGHSTKLVTYIIYTKRGATEGI